MHWITNRFEEEHIDMYNILDENIEWLPISTVGMPTTGGKKKCPNEIINQLLPLARLLAKDVPFVRVDFNIWEGVPFFGELTFYPTGGFGKYTSLEGHKKENWDLDFGNMLQLPKKRVK